MRSIIATAILASGSLCANATLQDDNTQLPQKKSGHIYIKLSDQWLICPGFGVGYRYHRPNSFHGFDVDLTAYYYWDPGYSIYEKAHYLFYPYKRNFYLGIGLGIMGGKFEMFEDDDEANFILPSADGILGYEWEIEKSKIFLQFELGVAPGGTVVYPALSLGVGF